MPEKTKPKPMDRQRKQASNGDIPSLVATIADRDGNEVALDLLPIHEWAFDYQRRLTSEDFAGFAEAVLTPESFQRLIEAKPTVGAFDAFLESIEVASGEDLGESSAS